MLAKDAVAAVTLIVSCAVFLTNHLALAAGLARVHQPRWHVWFVLLPISAWLAPYWGFRHGLRRRSWLWLVSGLAYVLLQITLIVTG